VRFVRIAFITLAAPALLLIDAGAARACHSYTVSVSADTVAEGSAVTVTVRRDVGVTASQVHVQTVDGTAVGGRDYEPIDRVIAFGAESIQRFDIAIVDDAETEPAETFGLHLSDPGGCALNTNYVLGPDARVTILANDPGPDVPNKPFRVVGTPVPAAATTSTTEPVPVVTDAPTVPTIVVIPTRSRDDGGGSSAGIILVILAVAAVGAFVMRRARGWRRRA
jgi:hypothetical protein